MRQTNIEFKILPSKWRIHQKTKIKLYAIHLFRSITLLIIYYNWGQNNVFIFWVIPFCVNKFLSLICQRCKVWPLVLDSVMITVLLLLLCPPLRLRRSSVSNANFLCIAIVDTITHVSSSPNISHRNGTPQVQRQKAEAQIGQGLAPKSHRPELKSYSGVEDVDVHSQVHWQRSRMTTLVITFSESSFGRKSLWARGLNRWFWIAAWGRSGFF